MADREELSTEGGWLIEWDGGFDTADSEDEAWKKVDAMIAKWGDADRDEFTVGPNVELD